MHATRHGAPRFLLIYPLVLAISGCASLQNSSGEYRRSPSAQRPDLWVITAEEIEGFSGLASVEDVLLGLVPGVRLGRREDGGLSLQIVRMTTNPGADGPLFVINGIPTPSAYGSLGINPHDIARIEVLRDAGKLSMYGSRGSAGVVLITLKK